MVALVAAKGTSQGISVRSSDEGAEKCSVKDVVGERSILAHKVATDRGMAAPPRSAFDKTALRSRPKGFEGGGSPQNETCWGTCLNRRPEQPQGDTLPTGETDSFFFTFPVVKTITRSIFFTLQIRKGISLTLCGYAA